MATPSSNAAGGFGPQRSPRIRGGYRRGLCVRSSALRRVRSSSVQWAETRLKTAGYGKLASSMVGMRLVCTNQRGRCVPPPLSRLLQTRECGCLAAWRPIRSIRGPFNGHSPQGHRKKGHRLSRDGGPPHIAVVIAAVIAAAVVLSSSRPL